MAANKLAPPWLPVAVPAGHTETGEPAAGMSPPVSPRVVSIALVLAGAALVLLADAQSLTAPRLQLLVGALGLDLAAVAIWFIADWRPALGRWCGLAALLALANWGIGGLGMVGFASLWPVLPMLAMTLVGFRAALVAAVAQSLLLLFPAPFQLHPAISEMAPFVLIATWAMVALLYAMIQPVQQIANWSLRHFQRAQQLLDEARNRQGELAQALDDLAHANRQLTLLNEKLAGLRLLAEEAQNAKALFVAKVSHELRTPLNIIISLIDLLVETPDVYGDELPPPLLEDLRIVHRNCVYLSHMINDVLDLSQAEAGQLSLRRSQLDLGDTVRSAVEVVQPLLDKKKLTLRLDLPPGLPPVYCDPQRTRQVILNLVSNAARFTEQGGVTITAKEARNAVAVSVADTGAGINREDAQRIFEPFFQGGNQNRAQSGYGLGLSISKQIIELQEGRMWFESAPDVGSTFYFSLPLATPEAHPSRPSRWIRDDWLWHEQTRRRKPPEMPVQERVVVCDASGELPAMLAHGSDGVEFIAASTVAAALAELDECPAHALIINAPTPQQAATLAEAAQQGAPDTLIVACAFPAQLQHARAAGATGYLVKPVMNRQLQQALRALGQPLRRVLLVDDDPDFRRLATRMLSAYDKALQVMVATNGAEALAALRRHPPDLLLLDVVLPDMQGWEVLAHKQQDAGLSAIPTLMLSAQDPADLPRASPILYATIGRGFSLNRLSSCVLGLSGLLSAPIPTPGRAPEAVAAGVQA